MYLCDYILNCDLFTPKQQFIISILLKGKRTHEFFCSITNMFKSSQSVSMTITLLNKKVNCVTTRDNQGFETFDLYSIDVSALLNFIKNEAGVSCVYQLSNIDECDIISCKETYMHESHNLTDYEEVNEKTENKLNDYLLDLAKNDVKLLLKEIKHDSLIDFVNEIQAISDCESIHDFLLQKVKDFTQKFSSSITEQNNLRENVNMSYIEVIINDNLSIHVDTSIFTYRTLTLIEYIDSSYDESYNASLNFDYDQAIHDLLIHGLDEYYTDNQILSAIKFFNQSSYSDLMMRYEVSLLGTDAHKIMSVFDFVNSCLSYDKEENQLSELIYIKHEIQDSYKDLNVSWSCKFCDKKHKTAGELVLCSCHFKGE